MTAVEGPEGAFWNPAGLAGVNGNLFVVFRGEQVAGTATAASGLFARPGIGTAGVSYLLLDVGDQDLTDDAGNVLGTVSVRNHLGVVSGAARLATRLSVGVSFKVVQFRLSCRGSSCPDQGTTATTYAFDAGLQGSPLDRLRLGAMVAHVGPNLQVRNAEQADPLPARVRVAASYDVVHLFTDRDDFRGSVGVEVQDRLRDLGRAVTVSGNRVHCRDNGRAVPSRGLRAFGPARPDRGIRPGGRGARRPRHPVRPGRHVDRQVARGLHAHGRDASPFT